MESRFFHFIVYIMGIKPCLSSEIFRLTSHFLGETAQKPLRGDNRHSNVGLKGKQI